jgi:hypothetical protein
MKEFETASGRFQRIAYILLALVTLGWMAGLAFGFAIAASNDASFVRDTPAWLTPALQGVVAAALAGVLVTLLAIVRRIRIRAHVLSGTLPRLLSVDRKENARQ